MNRLITFSTMFGLLSMVILKANAVDQIPFNTQRTLCVAELISKDTNAQINLRSGAGVEQKIVGYGLPGDLVYILGNKPPEPDVAGDKQGKVWYRVGFPQSKAVGWIRQDFLKKYCTGTD